MWLRVGENKKLWDEAEDNCTLWLNFFFLYRMMASFAPLYTR